MCHLLFPQAESSNSELSLLLNKLHSEEAALRDTLAKMSSMNEGLAQDKTDLNTYILQVRGDQKGIHCNKTLRPKLDTIALAVSNHRSKKKKQYTF